MALAKVDSLTRAEVGASTATAVPSTRGFVLNGRQNEFVLVTKLTGDTTGSIDLSGIQRPTHVYVIPTRDGAGVNVDELLMTPVTYTHTDADTIALSDLGDWTVAIFVVSGRSYGN
jgi:hypothetical protein